MTRKSFVSVSRVVLLLILMSLLLTGCGCKHEWQAANCETPKTCTLCQVTEGEALGHTWADATCAAPKTCTGCGKTEGETLPHTWVDVSCAAPKHCSTCKATEGEALPHTWVENGYAKPKTCSVCKISDCEVVGHTWFEADCDDPKLCKICGATEGESLGHIWTEATCKVPKTCTRCKRTEGYTLPHDWLEATTDSPKICNRCGETVGNRIMTDSRFQTAFCKNLFGTWKGTLKIPGSKIIANNFTGTLELDYSIKFTNDGRYQEVTTISNQKAFVASVEQYYTDTLYQDFAAQGYTREQADEVMKTTYGMDVKAYANKLANSINFDKLVSPKSGGVYYVYKETLYTAPGWQYEMESSGFKISGNKLTIDSFVKDFPDAVLTKS